MPLRAATAPRDDRPDDVHVVTWPIDADERAAHGTAGRLVLYLVGLDDVPPDDLGVSEDWIRCDADPIEVHWRVRRLRQHHLQRHAAPQCRDGCIFFREATVVLPPSCERIAELLCDAFDSVVTRAQLLECGTAEGPLLTGALNTRLHRIRQLLLPVGLTITNVRGRGYLLQATG